MNEEEIKRLQELEWLLKFVRDRDELRKRERQTGKQILEANSVYRDEQMRIELERLRHKAGTIGPKNVNDKGLELKELKPKMKSKKFLK